MRLRLVLLSVGLLPTLWFTSTAEEPSGAGAGSAVAEAAGGARGARPEKRFSINMMDPFTRRSALDKNFVRFGRSGSSSSSRESRGRPDSFVRFGRAFGGDGGGGGEEDDLAAGRRGELEEDPVPIWRDSRGRTDFIRFGRGRQDNFIRFGRGDKNNGFIRFGRARNDNFVRFGRGRPDNFIRFGKRLPAGGDLDGPPPGPYVDDDDDEEDEDDLERTVRGGSKLNNNFVRFGKRDPEHDEEVVNAYKNGMRIETRPGEGMTRVSRIPSGSRSSMKSDGFIRFGRSFDVGEERTVKELSNRIANFLKDANNLYPAHRDDGDGAPVDEQLFSESNAGDAEGTAPKNADPTSDLFLPYGSSSRELVRKRRSTTKSASVSPSGAPSRREENRSTGYDSFYSQLPGLIGLPGGLPGFIMGPELAVLPARQPGRNRKCAKSEDNNFIRLG